MKIPNCDFESQQDFKQLYDFMPQQYFTMLTAELSGSGKSNTLTEKLLGTMLYYGHLYLYANTEQPKYKLLAEKLEKAAKKIRVGLDDILTMSDIIQVEELDEGGLQKVVVFDDYVCDPQKEINHYFFQGQHKRCSGIYLTHSYDKTPRDIRLNCSHYIFFDFDKRERI